jgi:hypothetical protein
MAAVKRHLGETEFMAHCSIGLGVLDERSGPRSVKTLAKRRRAAQY